MWIERLMAGISHQHVLSYNPLFSYGKLVRLGDIMVYFIRYRLCSYSLSRSVNKWHKELKADEGRL